MQCRSMLSSPLFYRKDLFEDTILKRMYYEKTGNELTVPDNL